MHNNPCVMSNVIGTIERAPAFSINSLTLLLVLSSINMPDQKTLEIQLLDFLIKQAHSLLPLLPLSVSDLFEKLCCENIQSDYFSVEEQCRDLARYLPNSFVTEHFQGALDHRPQLSIVFYDPQVLSIWRSANGTLTDVPSANSGTATNPGKKPTLLFLLQAIMTNQSTLSTRRGQLSELITRPTSEQCLQSSLERNVSPKSYTEICHNSKRSECLKQGKLDCLRKIHFEPIIQSSTDVSIGDCSYLDTCYKGKSCKYVHYKIVYPDAQASNEKKDNTISFYFSEKHSKQVRVKKVIVS
jgi:hypothetical protein